MIRAILENVNRELLSRKAERLPEDEYSHMKYLRWLPLMRFDVERYHLENYGSVFCMHTTTKMGMELLTLSFMPGEGKTLPYLLMDIMEMKKKRCVFVEYYACGNQDLQCEDLKGVWEMYKDLPEYEEKPGWYIAEREPYSLIKTGEKEQLISMAVDSVSAYLSMIEKNGTDQKYPEQLRAFRERMITDGNPSSKTLNMLLGKEGADRFMREIVMPIPKNEERSAVRGQF